MVIFIYLCHAKLFGVSDSSAMLTAEIVGIIDCSLGLMTADRNLVPQTSGYGFVDFDSPAAALKAVHALKTSGIQAQMAKVSLIRTRLHVYVCVCVCIL